jgi:hypothetical protein
MFLDKFIHVLCILSFILQYICIDVAKIFDSTPGLSDAPLDVPVDLPYYVLVPKRRHSFQGKTNEYQEIQVSEKMHYEHFDLTMTLLKYN